MSDKLLVEINLFNGEIDDAVPALVYLTNELYESGVFEVSGQLKWNEKQGSDYELKWRFAESELSESQVTLDVDLLYQISDTLKRFKENIAESEGNAIEKLQKRLESYLSNCRVSLLTDAY